MLVGLGGGLGVTRLVGLRRWLTRLDWPALLVGLGGGLGVTRLVRLLNRLARLTEKSLIGVVARSGSCIRNELGVVLLPLVHDDCGDSAAHDGHGEHPDKRPDPHGSGAALPLGVL